MNAALKICQERYDAQLPPDISEANPEQEWLEHSAEQLVCGMDIKWKRRFGRPQVVTFDRYCTYLQGILNQRQIDGLDERDSLARLFLSAILGSQSDARTHAADLIGQQRPIEAAERIAMELLKPYAADAVAAEREEREDDVDGDL
ncbi:hypothetical protein GHO29_12175 [Pseudomonas helleri]|uniref:Uncharacterized protein n=1 Tax=Pseudomonas helleri TaxID=1608996 RepID=A0A7X2CDH6_9PSED|nr:MULTISPECIES: hypothetical protein [Pseudomonas]MQU27243.1 hypothetical protein [Pseudomonas helleri]MRU52988.1 hypothetical protein [Pseudomonas gessardii]NNA20411.1 hypothetical protein [Pseudomonas lundensis]NNA31037.1 hypothetical protein [Pseudomonas lundensis]ONH38942.1 hypothetical protein BLL38_21550 [Pseudomonas gessardii]